MKKLLLSLILLSSITFSFANNDRYRLVITDDPATTITIGWDQIGGGTPTVHYGTTDFGTNWSNYPNTKGVDRAIVHRSMNNNFVKLTGLTPNTAYYFVIKDDDGTSDRFWFKTTPTTNERLSFIAGGDSRNNRTPRQMANLLVSKLKPHAVFFGGDMTNGDSDSEWIEWFDDWQLTIASDGRMIPLIPARGNHEGSNDRIYHLFDVPSTSIYFDTTFGANLLTIYTLNSNIAAGGSQKAWLEGQLSSNTAIWRSAQYHKPMRPHTSGKSEGNDQYNNWAQLFYDHKVKLVFDSDSHTVKTTWPVKPCSGGADCDEGFERDDINGTTYAGEGCWGAPLRNNDDDKTWTRNSDRFNQFKWVFVDEDKIEMRTIKVDNAVAVGENPNNDPFNVPSNLDIWNPSNGDVVYIYDTTTPVISFPSETQTAYSDGSDINLEVKIDSEGDGIDYVEFYVDGVLMATDNSSPYGFSQSYADGAHEIEAIAYDINGITTNATLNIYIGTYNDTGMVQVSAGIDDVEESEAGVLYTDSSDLEMVYDSFAGNGYQTLGLRFQNIDIPQRATITSAYIQFRSDETNSANAELLFFAEDSPNAAPFDDSAAFNVSSRDKVSGSVTWNPPAWNSTGQVTAAQQTSDLSTLLQQVVDNCEWNAGNSSVFIIQGTGVSLTNTSAKRVADSYEGGASNAPKLYFTYTYDAADAVQGEPEIAFNQSIDTNYGDGTNLSFPIDVVSIGGGIQQVEFSLDGVSSYVDTTAPFVWDASLGDGSYVLEAEATDACGKTYIISRTINIGTVTVTDEVKFIANGNDDVEERQNGSLYTDSSDLEFVYDNSSNGFQTIGMRFTELQIPQGATITNAYLQFRSDETNSNVVNLLLFAEDSENAPAFNSAVNFNVSTRPRVNGSVAWDPPAWNASGQTTAAQRTPDVSMLLQQVVDHCNWEAGNNMVFIMEGTGSSLIDTNRKRTADSFEGGAANAPRLIYSYTFDAAAAPAGGGDSTAPVALCKPVTISLDENGVAALSPADIDNGSTDNCGIDAMTVDKTTFSCNDIGANTVIFTVVDANGNMASCSTTVTIQDTIVPVAACQDITVQLDANGAATIAATDLDNGSSDNCAIATMSIDVDTFTCDNIGANTVVFTITDDAGNTDTCTATVTVVETEAPQAICQNITVQLDVNGMASISAIDVDNGSTDNCAISTIAIDKDTFTCADLGENAIVFTVTDTSGNTNTCTATITVEDTVAPILACQDITVALDADGLAIISGADFENDISDNCEVASITLDVDQFTCADLGVNTVMVTATDSAGNEATCNANVTIVDTTAPQLVCQNITITLDETGTATILATDLDNGSIDNCEIETYAVNKDTFTCNDIGLNAVVLTVTDVNGNVGTCTPIVTVIDEIAPEITCPSEQTREVDVATQTYTLEDFIASGDVTAIDGCSLNVANMIQDPAPGIELPVGEYTITVTAEDTSGNEATCEFPLIVTDVLGVGEESLTENEITVYPNPASEIIYIEAGTNVMSQITIFDINGRQIQSNNNVGARTTHLNISELSSAVYFIKIETEQGIVIKRFLKK